MRRYARSLPPGGGKPVVIGARAGRGEEKTAVGTASAEVEVQPPHVRRGEYLKRPLKLWRVVARELDPPAGRDPLGWILLTNVPVTTMDQDGSGPGGMSVGG